MLGKTGIRVSQICFGSLTVSPLGAGLSEAEGAEVIALSLIHICKNLDKISSVFTFIYLVVVPSLQP